MKRRIIGALALLTLGAGIFASLFTPAAHALTRGEKGAVEGGAAVAARAAIVHHRHRHDHPHTS